MNDYKYFKNYLNQFKKKLDLSLRDTENLIKIKNLLLKIKKNKKKILIFGNGGSASIASHASTDFLKINKIRCVNFNEANLITCFSNDYGFENWIAKALELHADPEDLLILISSSGESKNMIRAAKIAKKKKISTIVTFTGFNKNNKLQKLGDINFWTDSKVYNFVENSHQVLILSIVDLINKTKI
jgi:D-sedoheptulose 7-phosphate isomerase